MVSGVLMPADRTVRVENEKKKGKKIFFSDFVFAIDFVKNITDDTIYNRVARKKYVQTVNAHFRKDNDRRTRKVYFDRDTVEDGTANRSRVVSSSCLTNRRKAFGDGMID